MGPRASIWYGAIARADAEVIEIGADSNVQDGSTLHSDPGSPLVIGERVTVGHNVVLHGARVDDDVLVGMGSTVLNGAHIGSGSIVAAGAVVMQGQQIPPNSLVAGVPAKVRRETTEDDRTAIALNARATPTASTSTAPSAGCSAPGERRRAPPAGRLGRRGPLDGAVGRAPAAGCSTCSRRW